MNLLSIAKRKLKNILAVEDFPYLQHAIIELNDIRELCKIFAWNCEPLLNDPRIYHFEYIEDVNERRIRDAETLATVIRNADPSICVEIGTAEGHGTALISLNAPHSQVYTVNIPPDEVVAGKGGKATTKAFDVDEIGSYYKQLNLSNITQIIANTATWNPSIGTVDIAFIDGCHDTEFVYRDTLKLLKFTKPGSFILWHDFNFNLVKKYHWIHSVCTGVELLLAHGLIKGRIYHVKDSWIGIYQVQE